MNCRMASMHRSACATLNELHSFAVNIGFSQLHELFRMVRTNARFSMMVDMVVSIGGWLCRCGCIDVPEGYSIHRTDATYRLNGPCCNVGQSIPCRDTGHRLHVRSDGTGYGLHRCNGRASWLTGCNGGGVVCVYRRATWNEPAHVRLRGPQIPEFRNGLHRLQPHRVIITAVARHRPRLQSLTPPRPRLFFV